MNSFFRRFLVFVGTVDAPRGGWNDYCGSFDTIEDARVAWADQARSIEEALVAAGEGPPRLWYQIIDTRDEHYSESGSA